MKIGPAWIVIASTIAVSGCVTEGSVAPVPASDAEQAEAHVRHEDTWEMHGCMIGATNGIAPIPGERDAFIAYYGAGDSVTGAAKITVTIEQRPMRG